MSSGRKWQMRLTAVQLTAKSAIQPSPKVGQHKDARSEVSVLACQEEAVTTVSYGGLLLNGQGAVFNNLALNKGAA